MEIERIGLEKMMILGIPYMGDGTPKSLNVLWERFFERMEEFSAAAANVDFYVLRKPVEGDTINYFVGVEVEEVDRIPGGMEVRYLMHEDYAVYPHRGGKKSVLESFRHIYSDLLPEKGFVPCEGYDLEVYTPHYYERDDKDGIIYLCVPIEAEVDALSLEVQKSIEEESDIEQEGIQLKMDDKTTNKPAPPVFERIVLDDDDFLPSEDNL